YVVMIRAASPGVIFFFFFQAEDGIRDRNVTGVQTCALPIWDILAFVPTIRGTELLAQQFDSPELAAFALHGQLSPKQQSAIVNPRGTAHSSAIRRVIFATDVAESSITVPGVRVVVDTCLSRVSRRDSSRGMSVLVTESAAQASCVQRAGRAGREGPGTVFRLISAHEWARL